MKLCARSMFTAAAVSAVGIAVGFTIVVREIGKAIDATRWDLDTDEDRPEPMLFDPVEDFERNCAPLLDAFWPGAANLDLEDSLR